MAFEGVEAASPQAPVRGEPPVELLEALRTQLVKAPLGIGFRLDQSSLAEHPEVTRGVRLAQSGPGDELAHGPGTIDEEIEYPPPGRLGHDLERGGHERHLIIRLYIYQVI
jgi:hypothetical protein